MNKPRKSPKAAFQTAPAMNKSSSRRSSKKVKSKMQALHHQMSERFEKGTLRAALTASARLLDQERTNSQHLKMLAQLGVGMLVSKFVNSVDDYMSHYERTELPDEEIRPGFELGVMKKQKISLNLHMDEDKQMKTAKALYKTQSFPVFDSQSSKYSGDRALSLLSSEAGYNRQGVWAPLGVDYVPPTSGSSVLSTDVQYQTFNYTMFELFGELTRRYVTSEITTWLGDSANNSADIYFPVNKINDVITFSNYNKFLPVDFKVYVCECKSQTGLTPQKAWFSTDVDTSGQPMTPDYSYTPTELTGFTGAGYSTPFDWTTESAVHIAATPFFSPQFRQLWDVIDVVKFQLEPSDKMELTIERTLGKALSYRDLYFDFLQGFIGEDQTFPDHIYTPGDLALIVTFRGVPCFLKYGDSANGKAVNISPTKVAVNSRSTIVAAFPQQFTTEQLAEDNKNQFISGEGRVLDTDLDNDIYDSQWQPVVMTNTAKEDGGSKI